MKKYIFAVIFFALSSLVYSQNNYFVSKDGSKDFSTIKQLNSAKFEKGDIVSFNSGEQFADATLKCKEGVTYNTYGGAPKAIIGDPTVSSFDVTIVIEYVNVTLNNLKIYGYKNAKQIVNYSKGYLDITYCEIYGGDNAHVVETYGINQTKTISGGTNVNILNNKIAHMNVAIHLSVPYNYNIGYNEMYQLWRRNGVMDRGGSAVRFRSTKNVAGSDFHDANYTFKVYNNNIYEFDYVAFQAGVSRTIYEYNEIHHSLDERIYRGGVKHGSVGKIYDNTATKIGCLGLIFRYNYIHDLVRRGEPGYTYGVPEDINFETGEPVVVSTNNGGTTAWYLYAANPSIPSYGKHFGDDVGEGPDNVVSGLGYANYWVHNNLFYNCSNKIMGRSYNYYNDKNAPFENSLGSYFVNNTIMQCGFGYVARNHIMATEYQGQSPHTIVNNIIDYQNPTARSAVEYKEDKLTLDNNIYLHQTGLITDAPSEGTQFAAYQKAGNNLANGLGEQYKKDPNWNNPNSTIFAPNIGTNGVYIPDVTLTDGGNAHNAGMDFNRIGDTYTVLNQKHNKGKDPSGKSFAYDLLGNLRTSNDIGALGAVLGNSTTPTTTNLTPIITVQPFNLNTNIGEQISFSVSATCDDEIGYQWWKSPFINTSESKITNSNKYSGVATNKLIINSITNEDSKTKYVCEVYNKNNPSSLWINTDPVSINIQKTTQTKTNLLKVFLEAPYNNGKMNSALSSSNDFPTSQPYNKEPWNLDQNANINENLKSNYIDWIIVELRKENSQTTYRKAGILTLEGNVVNNDATNFSFENIISGEYYIVLVHRNHLDIISSTKVMVNSEEELGYDFTYSQSSVIGIQPMTKMDDGRFAMIAGDGDANGIINNLDFGKVANNIPAKGYLNGDLNMDGTINVLDYYFINTNILKKSNVP